MKKLVFFYCTFLSYFIANAQDTLFIQPASNVQLIIPSADYSKIVQDTTRIQKSWDDLINDLKKIAVDFDDQLPQRIDYFAGEKFIIHQSNTRKLSVSEDSNSIRLDFRHCIKVYEHQTSCGDPAKNLKMIVKFDKMDDLMAVDFQNIIGEVLLSLPGKSRKSYNILFHTNGLDPKKSFEPRMFENSQTSFDAISLNAGAGPSLIKNQWAVSLRFELGLMLGRKGQSAHRFTISDEMIYHFNSEDHMVIDNVLSLGYAYNLAALNKPEQWVGLEFGMLTNKDSFIFNGNTYRLGLLYQFNNHWSIRPSLYFENNFQRMYPGISVVYSF